VNLQTQPIGETFPYSRQIRERSTSRCQPIQTLIPYRSLSRHTAEEGAKVLSYSMSPRHQPLPPSKQLSPCGGKLTFGQFSSVTVLSGRKIRFVITAGTELLIRQLVVGEAMVAETGQFASMQYPTLLGGLKLTNSISANGSIIGRDVKRVERMGSLNLDLLTPSWVRSTWEPFAYHAARYPFIYVPNFAAYPNEVAFSVAESIDAPSNMGKGARMAVQWKLRHVVADEYGV
jgi:hypothetical protein